MNLGANSCYTYNIRPTDPYRTAGTATQPLGLGDSYVMEVRHE